MNYNGRFPVKYMLQQRMVRKLHDDDHCTNALLKYAREYAINIETFVVLYALMISTK